MADTTIESLKLREYVTESETDRDFICVQSFDGVLSVFEQEQFAFTRYLNNFLVPGPLCYIHRNDCFVTANAAMEVQISLK